MHVHVEPLPNLQQAANGGLLHDIVLGGVQKKCREPETVVGFHHGGAECLRRSATVVSGVQRKCREPETVGNFITGVQSPQFREWSPQEALRA